jgi:hypothetical protein
MATKGIGLALLLLGIGGLLVGPAEMHAFTFFQAGGRFHYEGFGLGSLMFANIAIQIAGYYVIAAICVPLGYGHLRLKWWAKPIMITLLVDWLLIGLPFALMALMIFVQSKGVTALSLPFVILSCLLVYPVLPAVLLRFYRNPKVLPAPEGRESGAHWLLRTSLPVRVAGSLLLLIVLVLHFPLLFDGFFPFFGRVLHGFPGVLTIDLSIALTVLLLWGVFRRQAWAWWSSLAFLLALLSSSTWTFLAVPPKDILSTMPFAPRETEALSGLPVRGYHLALFFGLLPGLTLVAVARARHEFRHSPGS